MSKRVYRLNADDIIKVIEIALPSIYPELSELECKLSVKIDGQTKEMVVEVMT